MQRGRGGYRHPPKILNQAAKDRSLGNTLGGAVFGEARAMLKAYLVGPACSNMSCICAGATAETLKECTTGLVFGLPASNWNWVQHVKEGYAL